MATQNKELHLSYLLSNNFDVLRRFEYACSIAPGILAIHPFIKGAILFGSVTKGVVNPKSDIDIAAVYTLEPFDFTIHQQLLTAYRDYKKTLKEEPLPVHLLLIDDTDLQEGKESIFKAIREEGIVIGLKLQ